MHAFKIPNADSIADYKNSITFFFFSVVQTITTPRLGIIWYLKKLRTPNKTWSKWGIHIFTVFAGRNITEISTKVLCREARCKIFPQLKQKCLKQQQHQIPEFIIEGTLYFQQPVSVLLPLIKGSWNPQAQEILAAKSTTHLAESDMNHKSRQRSQWVGGERAS